MAKESAALEVELAALAELTTFEYDKVRKDKAKELGVRVTSLDDAVERLRGDGGRGPSGTEMVFPEIKAADSVLSGWDILDRIASRIRKQVVMTDVQRDSAALWTMHTHCHDAAEHSPILIFESPEAGCGKTTAMHTVAKMVPRPLETSNISVAALFRLVEKYKPTIGVDEADTFAADNDELRGLLNSGHDRESARFIRLVGDASNYEPRAYATWSPKMMALLGKRLHPALISRAIRLVLQRAAEDEEKTIEPLRKAPEELRSLAAKPRDGRAIIFEALSKAEPELPPGLRGRDADNWRPLIAIANWRWRLAEASTRRRPHPGRQRRRPNLGQPPPRRSPRPLRSGRGRRCDLHRGTAQAAPRNPRSPVGRYARQADYGDHTRQPAPCLPGQGSPENIDDRQDRQYHSQGLRPAVVRRFVENDILPRTPLLTRHTRHNRRTRPFLSDPTRHKNRRRCDGFNWPRNRRKQPL